MRLRVVGEIERVSSSRPRGSVRRGEYARRPVLVNSQHDQLARADSVDDLAASVAQFRAPALIIAWLPYSLDRRRGVHLVQSPSPPNLGG